MSTIMFIAAYTLKSVYDCSMFWSRKLSCCFGSSIILKGVTVNSLVYLYGSSQLMHKNMLSYSISYMNEQIENYKYLERTTSGHADPVSID